MSQDELIKQGYFQATVLLVRGCQTCKMGSIISTCMWQQQEQKSHGPIGPENSC